METSHPVYFSPYVQPLKPSLVEWKHEKWRAVCWSPEPLKPSLVEWKQGVLTSAGARLLP